MVTEPSTSSERMIERELMVTGEAVAVEIIPATVVNRIASGLCRVHIPTTRASAISATMTPQVHQRIR